MHSRMFLPFLVAFLALAMTAAADEARNSGGPAALVVLPGTQTDDPIQPGWGGAAGTSVTYAAHAFSPINSAVTYDFSVITGNLAVHRTNATPDYWLEAPINLPNGSLITAIEFRFCDTTTTSSFASFLTIHSRSTNIEQPLLVTSTSAEAPGCVNRTFAFSTPIEVNNQDKAYSLEVWIGAPGGTIKLAHARVYYRLQVSPAPAVASFTDVPTGHLFYQYIEALAASGITTGCAPGMYCPDAFVTRGQMAVFLARALGLHWPN